MTGLDFTFDPADAERADAEARLRWFRSATGRNLVVSPAVAALLEDRGVDVTLVEIAHGPLGDEPQPASAFEPKVIAAVFEGMCPECDLPIHVGDLIRLDVEHEPRAWETGKAWVHDVCPTPRGTTVCPSCFLERPCPCEDEQ